MILVTVGTEKFAFNRLMKWVEKLIEENYISPQEEIIIQYGSCTYIPNNTKAYTLIPEAKFEALLSQSRLIIAHCGEGTIDTLAQMNVPFILVPRNHQFSEHVDDHQIELADALAEQGVAIAKNIDDLKEFITNPTSTTVNVAPSDYYASASRLIEREFITTATQSFVSQGNLINSIFKNIQKRFIFA